MAQLRRFRLAHPFIPLLQALKYREECAGIWSDGDSAIVISAEDAVGQDEIGFIVQQRDAACRPILFTPTGLGIGIDHRATEGVAVSAVRREYTMNHVSIRTPDIDADHRWFKQFLGNHTVLSDESHFNPLDNRIAPERHLWMGQDFYITLRGSGNHPVIDHVGWMAASIQAIDSAATLIERLGLDIVMGPLYVDGSYLIHFRGPDGRVHDFFFPTSQLHRNSE